MLLKNIHQLIGLHPFGAEVLRGDQLKNLPQLQNAWLHLDGDKIADFGSMSNLPEQLKTEKNTLDCTGKTVMPAWCDSHTHLVYAGSREQEFVDRILGLSYEDIAKRGGGILNSAKLLNDTTEEELFNQSWKRLQEVIKLGTGAIEIKSGYGLTVESEIKMLRVINLLKEKSPIPIKRTLLIHAYPIEFKFNHKAYLKIITEQLIPQVAKENLADYIDVFCEEGFFSADETDILLKAGIKHGLKPKVHANQLHFSGGIQVGVANNALSVDHLECVGDDEINALKRSDTIGTLLPSAAFFLNLPYQPARKIINSDIPIALASDYNPGSSPSGNMNFVASLACIKLKMLPEEAINAGTLNGAYAMELADEVGSISKGKKANLIITKPMVNFAFMLQSFGNNLIEQVIINGEIYN